MSDGSGWARKILSIPDRGDDDPVNTPSIMHEPIRLVELPFYRVDQGAQHR